MRALVESKCEDDAYSEDLVGQYGSLETRPRAHRYLNEQIRCLLVLLPQLVSEHEWQEEQREPGDIK